MLPINQYITQRNRTISNRKSIQYLTMHYVGAVSCAKNNCAYFYSTFRGASAHYFVDDDSIWQCVRDKDIAWHCGNDVYYNGCRNSNSIGIEMCCYSKNGKLDISADTEKNALDLAAYICKKYNIPISRVVRHYDVTRKNCPAPFVKDTARWNNFKNKLSKMLDGKVEKPSDSTENNTMKKTMYVTANSGLNVRSGAGTNYSIVGGLSKGTKVTVYEESNGWSRIGSGQWVSSQYLAASNSTSAKTMYVTPDSGLNVRTGAGTSYRIIKALTKGTKVTVYEEKNGWSRIGDGQWVSSQYLSSSNGTSSTKTMYVKATAGLNVRSGAGTNYSIVKALPNGTKVTVYEQKNGWSRIGSRQWVSSQYLTSTKPTTVVTKKVNAKSGLNVRSGAGTNYPIVKALTNGTKVTVYETSNGWSRIGSGQWVSSQYLK